LNVINENEEVSSDWRRGGQYEKWRKEASSDRRRGVNVKNESSESQIRLEDNLKNGSKVASSEWRRGEIFDQKGVSKLAQIGGVNNLESRSIEVSSDWKRVGQYEKWSKEVSSNWRNTSKETS
jgi:hypothetical protein